MGSTLLSASKKAKTKSKPAKNSSNKNSESVNENGEIHPDRLSQVPSKKRKAEPKSQPDQDDSKDSSIPEDMSKPKTKSKSRKSVTFSEDTKPQEETADVELTIDPEDDPDSLANRRAAKRRKRDERRKDRSASVQTKPEIKVSSDPVLSYLSTYQNSRSEWKFQKNRETAVIKNCFSIDRIPASYNSALSAYLSSLKGEAAKKRIVEAAKEAISNDDKKTDWKRKMVVGMMMKYLPG
ncbi:proteasome subunit alpha type 6 [Arthroderma uncinatum]|uniref:proteasome subunit alpha type 6 n=1 Tax=Arthroderma uncinatum TaxID=74035 RepID=UPI00144A8057|nr:proteasome subunit alpha type 6 [Arthroderma uncinatum]KAF3491458.1 proteasome subunit alpha type 6 [Arthroderma uncinatum]